MNVTEGGVAGCVSSGIKEPLDEGCCLRAAEGSQDTDGIVAADAGLLAPCEPFCSTLKIQTPFGMAMWAVMCLCSQVRTLARRTCSVTPFGLSSSRCYVSTFCRSVTVVLQGQ